MSKFKVSEGASGRHWHLFAVDDNEGNSVAHFTVATYGLAVAREKAEAECKFLNEKAERFEVREANPEDSHYHRFIVGIKGTTNYAAEYWSKFTGSADLARTEAARLCQMLNDRGAKGVQP